MRLSAHLITRVSPWKHLCWKS